MVKIWAKRGQRVRLLPNEEEGWSEEFGVIEGDDVTIDDSVDLSWFTAVVRIDDQYLSDDPDDDGLREVTVDQMELANE